MCNRRNNRFNRDADNCRRFTRGRFDELGFSIFLLTNAIATPIYGKLADSIGRKPIFMIGTTIFIIGSVMSGLSNSMIILIFWRAIQGIGGGAILPVANTIIADIYPLEKRAQV